ncbi:MAG: hypothetical protein M1831_002040 [Alyxoria varia]|nr:MAG: hypothetical protein M1831_002040 [Alyxoria varia]
MCDSFSAKSQAFIDWFVSQPGAILDPRVSLTDFRAKGAGRALTALEDVPKEVDLFTIPPESILCANTSDLFKCLPSDVTERLEDDQWTSLVLILLYEYLQGQASRWKSYLDVLPDSLNTLMFWAESELDELQASNVRDKVAKGEAEEEFRRSVLPVIHEYAHVFYPQTARRLQDDELLSLCHRMASTIMAYAFDMPRKDDDDEEVDESGYVEDDEDAVTPKGMMPLADMLNSDAEFNARLFEHDGSYSMKSLRDIKKGEEVLNDYGPLPRSELMRCYGYITPKYAPFDVAEIPKDLLVHVTQKYRKLEQSDLQERLSYLDRKEVLEDGYSLARQGRYSDSDDDEGSALNMDAKVEQLPDGLVKTLRALLVNKNEVRNLKSARKDRDMELWKDMGNVFIQILDERIAQYATTEEEDDQLLRSGEPQGRQKMAITVRLSEKQILREAKDVAISIAQGNFPHSPDALPEGPSPKRRKISV